MNDKINKILILTTAITRPDIHDITFKHFHKIFEGIETQWLINIDKINTHTQESTRNNIDLIFENTFTNYDVTYFLPNKPGFFHAAKRLITESEKYINDNTCVIWLEDDWLFSENNQTKYSNIIDIINNYYSDYCYISLGHNDVGTFPPFIIGNKLYKELVNGFENTNKIQNPEGLSTRIINNYISQHGCSYYLFNYPLNKLEQFVGNKERVDLLQSLYSNKDSHKKDYNLVLEYNHRYKLSHIKINLDNYVKYKKKYSHMGNSVKYFKTNLCYKEDYINKCKTKSVVVIRFGKVGGVHFFQDIGRTWKKQQGIEHTHL
jgi:hypothetical protein